MSAETLRRAAALMRERAQAAAEENDWKRGIAKLGRLTPKGQHMSGWHPTVALAVADWLDHLAQDEDHVIRFMHGHALTVARAYLGESQ